jgi:predicted phage replisome organizer
MAEVKWVKIPTDFFESDPIVTLREMPEGDSIIVLYLNLLCDAYKDSRKGIFSICNIVLTDREISAIFRNHYCDIGDKLKVLEELGLIKRNERSIQVFKFWVDKHDRNSDAYKQWRKDVYERDGYKCQKCGTMKELQAHHIEHWKNNKDLRYDVNNGITLCRRCHLEAHGGCWRNG